MKWKNGVLFGFVLVLLGVWLKPDVVIHEKIGITGFMIIMLSSVGLLSEDV